MRLLIIASVMGVLGVALSVGVTAGRHEDAAATILAVEGRANATPWMAARGAFVAVAWGATPPKGPADVFVAVSRDGGATFGVPVRVNRAGEEVRLGGELPPRVALVGGGEADRKPRAGGAPRSAGEGDPEIAVAWGAKAASPTPTQKPLTEIRIARSRDGGRTFQPSTALQTPGTPGDRGWHALALDEQGRAHVMWLDHRGMATRKPSEHDHHAAGMDMSQLSGLYYARSGGPALAAGAKNDGAERELTTGVCYCCKTALATGAGGRLYAAWRHVYSGNIRDIAFTMSRDAGQTFDAPSRVSSDEWQINGCPDDGPAMAVGVDGTVHIVWPTVIGGNEPAGALFYASTRDGRTFTPRQRIPTLGSPKPGHPQIALTAAGQITVAWDEILTGVRHAAIVTGRGGANGVLTFDKPQTLSDDLASAYPMLARTDDGLVAVWTRGPAASSVIAVRPLATPTATARPVPAPRP